MRGQYLRPVSGVRGAHDIVFTDALPYPAAAAVVEIGQTKDV